MTARRVAGPAARALTPLALACLVMLPRLLSPQFGLLDNGLTLRVGREVAGTWWQVLYLMPETGRFFPAYWAGYAAIFGIVGARPLGFFAVNVLLFAGLLATLARLVRLGGGTRGQAAAAAALLALSGPAIETFYTIAKAEPLQMTWVGLSLLAAAHAAGQPRGARLGGGAIAAAALLLAHATKETTVALVPIAAGWLAVERVSRAGGAGTRFASGYLAASLVAALAFAALRASFNPVPVGAGWYTRAYSVDAATIGAALFRIAAWIVRDFAFLLPLLLGLACVRGPLASRRLVAYAGVWMGGWAAVYLPWPATFEYYLLPFALGAAALGGAIAGDLARARRHAAPARRRALSGVLALAALLWAAAVANAVTDARVQLAVDRANAELVAYLGTLPERSRLVLNTPEPNEYLFELPGHLAELARRPDLVVQHVGRGTPDPAPPPAFVLTPHVADLPVPTVRVAVDESGARRAGATLDPLLRRGGERVYGSAQRARLLEVGLHRLLCPLRIGAWDAPAYCAGDRGPVARRAFAYGWQVHRLAPAPAPGPAGRPAPGTSAAPSGTARTAGDRGDGGGRG
jgi:hypothetical protein